MPKNQHFWLGAAVWAACAGAACRAGTRPPTVSRAAPALGVVFSVAAWGPDSTRLRAAVDRAFAAVALADAALSEGRPAAEIFRLNRDAGGGPQPVSPALEAVVREALVVGEATAGALSPVAPARRGVILDSLRHTISVPRGTELSVSRISRGFALDRALRVIGEAADSAILSLGGQYLTRTGGHRTVGVADPDNSLRTFARITLPPGTWGVSTVSPVEDPDVEDPRTGHPADGVRVVTVLARRASAAAAWSRAFYVLGCDRALALAPSHGVEVLCVDGGARWTSGLEGRVVVFATDSVAWGGTGPGPAPAPVPAGAAGPNDSRARAASFHSGR